MDKTLINHIERIFKDHVATLKDTDDVVILDFKKPDSCEYRIRFLFEKQYYKLHISGDLGELTATNYSNMSFDKFDDFVRDESYFEQKIDCMSKTLYYYDVDKAKKDLLNIINERELRNDIIDRFSIYDVIDVEEFNIAPEYQEATLNEWLEEVIEEQFLDNFQEFDFVKYNPIIGISSKGIKAISELIDLDYCELAEIGKKKSNILTWYLKAFELAIKQINKIKKDND